MFFWNMRLKPYTHQEIVQYPVVAEMIEIPVVAAVLPTFLADGFNSAFVDDPVLEVVGMEAAVDP